MKKIISLLLVLGMIMCCSLPVSADNLDFLTKTYKSYNAEAEISFELKEPLKILDVINELELFEYGDVKELVSSIFKSVIKMDMSAVMDDNYGSMQSQVKISSDIPFKLNDDFGGNVYLNLSTWVDMDLNGDAPKYQTILKIPFSDKYLVTDILENKESADIIKSSFNKEIIEKIQLEAVKSIKENAEIKINGKKINITFDDAAAKKYLFDVAKYALSLDEYKEITGMENPAQIIAIAEAFMEDIKIFDSIVIDCVLDKNGYIKEQNAEINVDLNIYDIMSSFGGYDEYITKENSNICLTIYLKGKYSDVNNLKEIEIPKINEDNSISLINNYEPVPEYEFEDYDYSFIYFYTDEYPLIDNNVLYFPFRNAVYGIDEACEIGAENGIITAVINDKTLKIQENTYKAEYDGVSYPLDNKLFEKNGTLYISDELMLEVLGYELTDFCTYIYDGVETTFYFEKITE